MPPFNQSRRSTRLEINFAGRQPLASWIRWAILAAGAMTLASQLQSLSQTNQKLGRLEMRAAKISAPANGDPSRVTDPKQIETTVAALERVVNRLSLEWRVLFQELESRTPREIALSGIEPDPESRTLVVSGVAEDYPSLLVYVESLRRSGSLTGVFLKRHEAVRNQPQQGVAFTLTAHWRELEQYANASTNPAN